MSLPDGHADDLGAPLGTFEAPRRVVSLVPNLSELVHHWGLADRVVGVTRWCVEPPGGFPAAQQVRGTKNPDVAAVIGLAPDLVIANEEENREIDVERLRAAGIRVHVTRVRHLDDLAGSLLRLGTSLGVPAAAAALVADIDAALADAAATAAPTRASVACAVWRDGPGEDPSAEGWWLLGADTYAASLLRAVGAEVVPAGEDDRYPRSTLGDLVGAEPSLVLLPDEPYEFGDTDVEDLAAHGLRAVPADGQALWWWGQRTPDALRMLASLLGPA